MRAGFASKNRSLSCQLEQNKRTACRTHVPCQHCVVSFSSYHVNGTLLAKLALTLIAQMEHCVLSLSSYHLNSKSKCARPHPLVFICCCLPRLRCGLGLLLERRCRALVPFTGPCAPLQHAVAYRALVPFTGPCDCVPLHDDVRTEPSCLLNMPLSSVA